MADFEINQAFGLALAACRRQGWKVPAAFWRHTPFVEQGCSLEILDFGSDASEGLPCLQIIRSLDGAVGVYVTPRSHLTSALPSNSWMRKPSSAPKGIALDVDTPPAADATLMGTGAVESLDFWMTDVQTASQLHPQAAIAVEVMKVFLAEGFPAAAFISENGMPLSLETAAPVQACDQIEVLDHRGHKIHLCWKAVSKQQPKQNGRGGRNQP